jgi:hypothetical protein
MRAETKSTNLFQDDEVWAGLGTFIADLLRAVPAISLPDMPHPRCLRREGVSPVPASLDHSFPAKGVRVSRKIA